MSRVATLVPLTLSLVYFLTWRDIKVRYKQAYLGLLWVVLVPILQAMVFALIFGAFFNNRFSGAYFPLVYAGTIFWNYYSQSLGLAVSALTGNANLILNLDFPRENLIYSSVLSRLPDLLIQLLVLFAVLVFYRIAFSPQLLWLPLLFLAGLLLTAGLGLFLSAANVYFRDISLLFPFTLSLWLFLTPVVYPLAVIPAAYRPLISLNPLTGVMENIHRVAIYGLSPDWGLFTYSLLAGAAVFCLGLVVFRKLQVTFADDI